MSLNETIDELKQALQIGNKSIEDAFRFSISKIQTDLVKHKLENYIDLKLHAIQKEITRDLASLESPIYIGFLGRYSHGKTALVNKLFSLSENGWGLPEGSGIVTSKVTVAEFNSDINNQAICYEVRGLDNRHRIDLEALRENVGGKYTDENFSLANYYEIELPVPSNNIFAKQFEDQRIKLVDMPGLGGEYKGDPIATLNNARKVDMLIVVIKITDIIGAGRALSDFLTQNSVPIIPVLTFYDELDDGNTNSQFFMADGDADEILVIAKNLIKQHLPMLEKHLINMIAVSAKSGYNINELRSKILRFVKESINPLDNFATPALIMSKRKNKLLNESIHLSGSLKRSTEDFSLFCDDIIQKSTQKRGYYSFQGQLRNMHQKNKKDAETQITKEIRGLILGVHSKADRITSMRKTTQIKQHIQMLENEINQTVSKNLCEEALSLFQQFVDQLRYETQIYVKALPITGIEKRVLDEQINQIFDGGKLTFEDVKYKAPSVDRELIISQGRMILDVALQLAKDPQVSIPFFIGMLIFMIGGKIPDLPVIGSLVAGTDAVKILVDFGPVLMVSSVAAGLLNKSSGKYFLVEAKQNIIEIIQNHLLAQVNDISTLAINSYNIAVSNLMASLNDKLYEHTGPLERDIDRLKNIRNEFGDCTELLDRAIQRFQARVNNN